MDGLTSRCKFFSVWTIQTWETKTSLHQRLQRETWLYGSISYLTERRGTWCSRDLFCYRRLRKALGMCHLLTFKIDLPNILVCDGSFAALRFLGIDIFVYPFVNPQLPFFCTCLQTPRNWRLELCSYIRDNNLERRWQRSFAKILFTNIQSVYTLLINR